MPINPVQLVGQSQYPDFVGQFLRGREFKQNQELNAQNNERQNQILALKQQEFAQQQQQLAQEQQAQKDREEVNFFGRAADLLSGLEEKDKPEVWQQVRDTAGKLGFDVADMPNEYSDQTVTAMKSHAFLEGYGLNKDDKVAAQEILSDGTVIQSGNFGVRVRTADNRLLTGQEAVDAVAKARKAEADQAAKVAGAREGSKLDEQINKRPELESRVSFQKNRLEWIKGQPNYVSKISSAESNQKVLEDTATQIKSHINALTTRYGASLSGMPGSEARLLKNQLATVKAFSAFGTLTDLKNSGGTLGAISAPELVLLESKLGALDQASKPEEIVRVLDQIVNFNQSSIDRLKNEYDMTNKMYSGTYDEVGVSQAKPKKEGGKVMVDANGNKAMVYPDGSFEEIQ